MGSEPLPQQVEPSRREGQSAISVARSFDVAVIGGGVVGCATARAFTLAGATVVLIEKAADILAGASKANSALLHTGFDAPGGSLELRLMQRGYAAYMAIRGRLNLPLLETGALVAAWTDDDVIGLDAVEQRARENGVETVRRLSRAEALSREPELSKNLKAALLVPGEHVIDAWSAPLAYIHQAVANGASVMFTSEVTDGAFDGERWRLRTTTGDVEARHVINCAGLYGDVVEARLLGGSSFTIRPRKGQFVVYDKPAAALLTTTILPVPNEITKGVVLARTIYGNVLVGPTAEDQAGRDVASVNREALCALMAKAEEIVPAMKTVPVTATYAGLRPASDNKAYRIRHDPQRHWVTLGGIRSTGLTAALGLAEHAVDLIGGDATREARNAEPIWTEVPDLSEHGYRDWRVPGYGEIVCHCELVTRREIMKTFNSLVPPGDAGGLKRRTRAGMGRCQGFYCGAHIAGLTQGWFEASPSNR